MKSTRIMATVFWDNKSVLLIISSRGTTITVAQCYCNNKKSSLKQKKRKVYIKGFFHGTVCSHIARQTQNWLEDFRWDVFGHSPYSLNYAPSDFHLFPQLKQHLGRKCFANNDDLKEKVERWLTNMVAEWCD